MNFEKKEKLNNSLKYLIKIYCIRKLNEKRWIKWLNHDNMIMIMFEKKFINYNNTDS